MTWPWSNSAAIIETEEGVVLRWPLHARRGLAALVVTATVWLVLLVQIVVEAPRENLAVGLPLAAFAGAIFSYHFIRQIRIALIATPDRLTVRNLYRTYAVQPEAIGRITMESRSGYLGPARTAMLYLKNGEDIQVLAVVGRKDEREGPEELSTRQLRALATHLQRSSISPEIEAPI